MDQIIGQPTAAIAAKIVDALKAMGYNPKRSSASAFNRSMYVLCGGLKIRVADHPNKKCVDIDVHVDQSRIGSVDYKTAINMLKTRLLTTKQP